MSEVSLNVVHLLSKAIIYNYDVSDIVVVMLYFAATLAIFESGISDCSSGR